MYNCIGDGDCGFTLRRGAEAILSQLTSLRHEPPEMFLSHIGNILSENMGGSSGALYCILLTATSTRYHMLLSEISLSEASRWAMSLRYGVESMMRYGGAHVGMCPPPTGYKYFVVVESTSSW